jgi:GntR family transcriptional regulator, transcriptional repressor for pyruvate dehydrogenase complex
MNRSSMASQVAHLLLDYVKDNNLGPGDRLPPERILATELQVARSALREALAALDLLGVVVSRQGSGTYLNDQPSELLPEAIEWGLMLGQQRTLDIAEARRMVEIDIAQLAAQRGTHEEIAELEQILGEMEATRGEPDLLIEADVRFHAAIAAMSKSTVLADILNSVRSLLRVWIRRGLTVESSLAEDTIAEHQAIFTAIASRDEHAARDAMSKHMTSAYRRLVLSLHAAR